MPAGYDAEVAELFRDLRAATALSEMDLAARLGTRADVVQSLEQGALYALPPWAETCRVVNAYGTLLNLDVRPLLRRIYAQLEAGIVELQPKPMPDVPVMTPREQDYSFPPSNAGGAPKPNPLDIPWPPSQAAPQPPQRNAWPNGPTAPSPQPPQAPYAWQNTQGTPPQQPQAWPGQQAPQPPRPNAQPQPQRQAQAQPQADRRPQPPRSPQPQPQAPQQQAKPRQASPAEPHPLDADFGVEPLAPELALEPEPQPEKPRRRPVLLKLAIGALVISIVAFGLWMTLTHAPLPTGGQGAATQSGTLDPDDPRSRKADKLPTAPGG
ncbi:MAG TPA: helix-turn-helix transcriptional regulator [Methyloceanibacter sp.]|jgi:hypothetical protein|nr:helix-turn-helix transcriptional regulator [Methyloceanibacter sp.]